MSVLPTYRQVADYFLAVAATVGDCVSNLKVQKLVYYSQAWYLATEGKPIFNEDFEAWIHGPVLPLLYEEFKKYGARPIDSIATSEEGEAYLQEFSEKYGSDFSSFMAEVTEEYFPRTAYELESLTHKEQPWIEARNGAAPDEPSRAIIRKETMQEYYRKYIV